MRPQPGYSIRFVSLTCRAALENDRAHTSTTRMVARLDSIMKYHQLSGAINTCLSLVYIGYGFDRRGSHLELNSARSQ